MKRVTVILTLLLMATSAYAGTHVFNFDDARQLNGNWFIRDQRIWPQDQENVDWSVENGELVAISHDVCGGLSGNWVLDDTYLNWKNYEMSCKFKLMQTLTPACRAVSTAAFTIHMNKAISNCLMLFLETSGAGGPWNQAWLGKSEWSWQLLPPLKASLEEGRWYTMKMAVENGNCQIFIDDELIIETRSINPNSAHGLVGVGIKNAEMHFDDFTLTGKDIPETLNPVSQDLITSLGLKPMIPEREIPTENLSVVSPGAKLSATWGQIRRTN